MSPPCDIAVHDPKRMRAGIRYLLLTMPGQLGHGTKLALAKAAPRFVYVRPVRTRADEMRSATSKAPRIDAKRCRYAPRIRDGLLTCRLSRNCSAPQMRKIFDAFAAMLIGSGAHDA